jgi:hypothetical protein
MPRILLHIFVALLLGLAVAACRDDDDDDSDDVTPSASIGATDEPEETPDDGDDKETPGPDETDDAGPEESPNFSATPARRGNPATLIEDPAAWFQQNYPGVSPGETDCQYVITEVYVDCGDRGEFAPDPPLVGAGVDCALLIVSNEPIAVRCTSAEPLTTAYYDIQA